MTTIRRVAGGIDRVRWSWFGPGRSSTISASHAASAAMVSETSARPTWVTGEHLVSRR